MKHLILLTAATLALQAGSLTAQETADNGYIAILRENVTFLPDTREDLPGFVYYSEFGFRGPEAVNNPRNYFDLPSIAGSGDELSRIVNLCIWAAGAIPHDGAHTAACQDTAIDIYNYHRATGNGINCTGKAIFLTELYLSMGIPARTLFCYPQEDDGDNHVITEVYSESLGKWIMMDPSWNVYVMDENGLPLGTREIRERLVDDGYMKLNDDCDLSSFEHGQWKDYLYEYMAKNLYLLECMSLSTFNLYSNMHLLDLHLVTFVADESGQKSEFEEWIITSDPEYFWSKPVITSYYDSEL
ncbi:MAG: transglutaminase-like domain-containing protein [Alistipes sp.]|nr:transglutaminase-like domain-containing protein [Alistipes sp.]